MIPIKINTASAMDIEVIFGIGKVLAKRIIDYRNKNGYFRGPEDLSKVDGIKPEFAIMLSTQFDWEIPTEEITVPRDWEASIIMMLYFGLLIWNCINLSIPNIIGLIRIASDGSRLGWIYLQINVCLLLLFFSESIRAILLTVLNLTTNFYSEKKIYKKSLVFGKISLAALGCLGLSHAIYYQFFAQNGWETLLENQGYMLGLFGGTFFILTMIPQYLLQKNPKLIANKGLRIIFDFAVMFHAINLVVYMWVFRNENPIWVSIIFGIISIYFLRFGFQMIRYGNSIFVSLIYFLPSEDPRKRNTYWMTWLNLRLPNVEDQKALKDALQATFPASKIRTVIGLVIFSAGGWILVNVLSSIVDWFVQNWLDKLFR